MYPGPALRIRAGERAGSSYLGPAGGTSSRSFPKLHLQIKCPISSLIISKLATHSKPSSANCRQVFYNTLPCLASAFTACHQATCSCQQPNHTASHRSNTCALPVDVSSHAPPGRVYHQRFAGQYRDITGAAPFSDVLIGPWAPSQGLPRPVDARLAAATISSPFRAPPLETSAYRPVDTLWFLTRERR